MLTQFAIQRASPRDKSYKLADGNGLFLLVQPNGKKHWRFRYFFAQKENMLAFGSFPEVPLAAARKKRDQARGLLADGVDPAAKKRDDKIAAAHAARDTFNAVAEARTQRASVAPRQFRSRSDALLLRLLKTPPQSRAELAEAVRRAKGKKATRSKRKSQ